MSATLINYIYDFLVDKELEIMELITEGQVIYLWSQQMITEVEQEVNELKSRNIAVNVENFDRIGLSK